MNTVYSAAANVFSSKSAITSKQFAPNHSTGFAALDYLHEEMLDCLESMNYFACISTASVLVEMTLRQFLTICEYCMNEPHNLYLAAKKYRRIMMLGLINNLGKSVPEDLKEQLHKFLRNIRNYYLHGNVPFPAAESDKDVSLIEFADTANQQNFMSMAMIGPTLLMMQSQAHAWYACTVAHELVEMWLPWRDMHRVLKSPELGIGKLKLISHESIEMPVIGVKRTISVPTEVIDQVNSMIHEPFSNNMLI